MTPTFLSCEFSRIGAAAIGPRPVGSEGGSEADRAGFGVGGPVFGALSAALVNYDSKQDNEVGDVARGVGKVALDVFNFLTKLNNKYDLTDKAGTAAVDAIDPTMRDRLFVGRVSDIVPTTTAEDGGSGGFDVRVEAAGDALIHRDPPEAPFLLHAARVVLALGDGAATIKKSGDTATCPWNART